MSSENFYRDLPAIDDFSSLTDLSYYRSLPDDWVIAVADLRGSTEAIARGKYKSVNSLGVALITAAINLTKPVSIPFVFGGDGASVCVPGRFSGAIRPVLLSVKTMARDFYGLDLRIGIVPVSDIAAAGKKVLTAKYRISEFCAQASFAGGGLRYAEDAVKNPASGYEILEKGRFAEADFYGFECRWSRFRSPEGETAAILVRASDGADECEVYGSVLRKIAECYGSFGECHPLKERSMKAALDSANLAAELNTRTFGKSAGERVKHWIVMRIQILIGIVCMKWKIRFGAIEWGKYKRQAIRNADVKKFDDMLRLVVAGNTGQRKKLEAFLEERHSRGDLFYGIHVSDAAIMTCFVADYAAEHYHFVDGADGGYAAAAVRLKEQMGVIR